MDTVKPTETNSQPIERTSPDSPKQSRLHSASYASYVTENTHNIIRKATKPIPNFTILQLAKIWGLVDKRGPNDCWLWLGNRRSSGYNYDIFYGVYRGIYAHRILYTLCIGPIPEGFTIDHVKARGCTDTLCCNPAHLEAVTQTEQIKRRDAGKPPLCIYGHPRTPGKPCLGCAQLNGAKYKLKYPHKFSAIQLETARKVVAANQPTGNVKPSTPHKYRPTPAGVLTT